MGSNLLRILIVLQMEKPFNLVEVYALCKFLMIFYGEELL